LNKWKLEYIFTEGVLDLSIHVLAERGEVEGHILGWGQIFPNFKENILRVIVADCEIEKFQIIMIVGQRAEEAYWWSGHQNRLS
jgi:hypothetical protein